MEMVAMDMKLRGMYIARQLSFKGVSFKIEEIPIDKEYIKVYNEAVALVCHHFSNLLCEKSKRVNVLLSCLLSKTIFQKLQFSKSPFSETSQRKFDRVILLYAKILKKCPQNFTKIFSQ